MKTSVGGRWRVALVSALVTTLVACGGKGGGGEDEPLPIGDPAPVTNPGSNNGDGGGGGDDLTNTPPGGNDNTGGEVVTNPPPNDTGSENKEPKKKRMKPKLVAIEGQRIPDSHPIHRFDPAVDGRQLGFRDPKTNIDANVTFRSSYFFGLGAGVFFWNHDLDKLVTVAKSLDWTDAGYLPPFLQNWTGPVFNDHNQVAFTVRNTLFAPDMRSLEQAELIFDGDSAVIQAHPDKKACEHFDLSVIAKTGDPAPRTLGYFDEFRGVGQNDLGEVGFFASFDLGILPLREAETESIDEELSAELADAGVAFQSLPPIEGIGVFLARPVVVDDGKKAKCETCEDPQYVIEAVVRTGDFLKGTWGSRFCGDEDDTRPELGPWLNNKGDVLFIADCVEESRLTPWDLDGSLFIRRAGKKHPELFVAIGGPGPKDSRISFIGMGQNAVNDEEAAMFIEVENDLVDQTADQLRRFPDQFLVTKKLGYAGKDDHHKKLEVCAYDEQKLTRFYELDLDTGDEGDRLDYPTIDSTGLIVFSAEAVLRDLVIPTAQPELVSLTDASLPSEAFVLPEEIAIILSCQDEVLDLVVKEGDKKPVEWKDTYWAPVMVSAQEESLAEDELKPFFRFGTVKNASNDDDFAAFVDFGDQRVAEGVVLPELTKEQMRSEVDSRYQQLMLRNPTGIWITGTEGERDHH